MNALAALIWIVPVALGFVLAAWLHRGASGLAWARAARAATGSALVVTGAWLLVRIFDWLSHAHGPLAWTGVARGLESDPRPLAQGVLRLGLGAGLLFALACAVLARFTAAPRPRPALAAIGAALAALAGLLVAATFASGPLAYAAAMPLDLAAFLPVIAGGVALGLLGRGEGGTDAPPLIADPAGPQPAAAEPSIPASVDPEPILKGAGQLKGSPLFQEGTASPLPAVTTTALDRVWRAAGGLGNAPGALTRIAAQGPSPGLLVGDLAAPTEAALVDAAALATLLGRAGRVLVLGPSPAACKARIAAALARLGADRPGPLVAGDAELRTALAEGTRPALTCLDLGDLSGLALGLCSPSGLSWLDGLELVLLVRVDQLAPIEGTHMALTLRRLGLMLGTLRVRPSFVAVGLSGAGPLGFLQQATLLPFEAIPLGTRSAPVRVYVRALPPGAGVAAAEITAAANLLAGKGVDVAVEDGVGELRAAAAGRPIQDPGYHGRSALALLDGGGLAAAFRARKQLAHQVAGGPGHLGVWWVSDSPLSRFLLGQGALAALEREDELPSPRPLAGLANKFLAAAHLEAALHEGRPDEQALGRAFGDAAVAELVSVRKDLVRVGRRARWNGETRTIEASSVLTAPGAQWPDPRRETVTANVVEVVNAHSGQVLRRVDRRVAPTRYYPHRVFVAGGTLVQVPGELPSGARILVTTAAAGAAPTDPDLTLELVNPTWAAKPEQHRLGKITLARGVAEVTVKERVAGAIPRGQARASVGYAPVSAEYPSRAVVVLFSEAPSRAALRHAGRLAADLVPAHLHVEPEDVEVVLAPDGFAGVKRAALVFVDRHVGGIGLAEAFDARALHDLLRWTWGVLYRCPCMKGCEACTPADVLAAGPEKVGALKLLGG